MISITYGEAKPEIARVCGVSGMPVADPRVLRSTNQAILELSQEGEWAGVVDQWHIVAADGNIVLPTHLDRLLQINIKGCPQTIASPWYQFVAYGPGTPADNLNTEFGQWWTDFRMIEDRGEHPTKTLLPEVGGPWRLRVYTSVDETVITDGTSMTPFCTIQGIDQNGEIVRTQVSQTSWFNGERIALDWTVPYVESLQEYSDITAFTKDPTHGPIRLTATDGSAEIELSSYVFSDTTPSYHHYYSRWLNNLTSNGVSRIVRARARRRFVPISEDTDILLISNLPALKEMVIAQWKRESDNLESYMAHKQTAIELMKREALSYRGKARVPGITFQRGFAIGSNIAALR